MTKKLITILLALSMLVVFSSTASALSASKNVTVTDNGVAQTYQTSAETVEEFLAAEGIAIGENDIIIPAVETPIYENYTTEITIARGFNVTVVIDGKEQVVNVPAGTTLGTLVAQLEKENKATYTYSGKLTEVLKPDQKVVLQKQKVVQTTTTKPLPYKTTKVNDDKMEKGTEKVVQEGVNGVKQITTTTTYENNKATSVPVVKETIKTKPIDKIIHVGTKEPEVVATVAQTATEPVGVHEEGFTYTASYEMNASAYTAGPESTGKSPGDPGYGITASGLPAQHGVVAVDPDVIPLGTKLYIDGYGPAIAADTGSAIDGYDIDLFYDDVNDAMNFGRRNVQVYILADQ